MNALVDATVEEAALTRKLLSHGFFPITSRRCRRFISIEILALQGRALEQGMSLNAFLRAHTDSSFCRAHGVAVRFLTMPAQAH